jgi:hypothetical protein
MQILSLICVVVIPKVRSSYPFYFILLQKLKIGIVKYIIQCASGNHIHTSEIPMSQVGIICK